MPERTSPTFFERSGEPLCLCVTIYFLSSSRQQRSRESSADTTAVSSSTNMLTWPLARYLQGILNVRVSVWPVVAPPGQRTWLVTTWLGPCARLLKMLITSLPEVELFGGRPCMAVNVSVSVGPAVARQHSFPCRPAPPGDVKA